MSDKQRADHVQAKYWNGFITRTEAQNVFNQQAELLQSMSMTVQKLDLIVSFYADKFGVNAEDINEWVKRKQAEVKTALPPYECVCEKVKPEGQEHEEACKVFNSTKRTEVQQAAKSPEEPKLIVEA